MDNFAYIKENEIIGAGKCRQLTSNILNIEISEEVYNGIVSNKLQYIWNGKEIIPNPEWDSIKLQEAKEQKIQENDTARDEALNQGVTYKNVLFDSDTDQKVNLLAIVSTMSDEDTIIWFGMDNQPLECTKEDLINIGGLITQLHNFCWNKNALIKAEINNAETVEEVEAIEIDYATPAEEQDSEAVSEGEQTPSDIIESEVINEG